MVGVRLISIFSCEAHSCDLIQIWSNNNKIITKMLSWLYWNNKKLYILSYYDCEKYPLSPLKLRFLALIEQYLPNISDPMLNSVHRSFVWFLWLNWCKSTFCPITVPNYSKCWPIMTSSIQELPASNCDITMTDCSRMVSVDAFFFGTMMLRREI